MTTLGRPNTTTRPVAPGMRGGWHTPAPLYRLISSPLLRAIFGWDLPRRDVRVVSRRPGTLCVDVGAGGGFYTKALKAYLGTQSTLVAIDPSPSGTQALQRNLEQRQGAELSCVVGDACLLPMGDESADTLFYGYSLEEVPDPITAVEEAHRVLRPGGELILFLWKPAMTRRRRRPIVALLDELFDRDRTASNIQNLRLRYRKPA